MGAAERIIGSAEDPRDGGVTELPLEVAAEFDRHATGPSAEVYIPEGYEPLDSEVEAAIVDEIKATIEGLSRTIDNAAQTEEGPRIGYSATDVLDFLLEKGLITQQMYDSRQVEPSGVVAGQMLRGTSNSPNTRVALHGNSRFIILTRIREELTSSKKE